MELYKLFFSFLHLSEIFCSWAISLVTRFVNLSMNPASSIPLLHVNLFCCTCIVFLLIGSFSTLYLVTIWMIQGRHFRLLQGRAKEWQGFYFLLLLSFSQWKQQMRIFQTTSDDFPALYFSFLQCWAVCPAQTVFLQNPGPGKCPACPSSPLSLMAPVEWLLILNLPSSSSVLFSWGFYQVPFSYQLSHSFLTKHN